MSEPYNWNELDKLSTEIAQRMERFIKQEQFDPIPESESIFDLDESPATVRSIQRWSALRNYIYKQLVNVQEKAIMNNEKGNQYTTQPAPAGEYPALPEVAATIVRQPSNAPFIANVFGISQGVKRLYTEQQMQSYADATYAMRAGEQEPVAGAWWFRKKPVVIEAVQYTRRFAWPDWFADAVSENKILTCGTGKLTTPLDPCFCEIHTLEGVMTASEGDWIIKGVKGELYPCKPEIFAATYEPATSPPRPPSRMRLMRGGIAGCGT